MQQLIKEVRQSTFIRHNAIFFFGSLATGFLNYLYYPVLGRLLIPTSFGEVQVLASLLVQISIFLNVLGLITVNIVTNYDNVKQGNRLIMELEKLALLLSVLLLLATIIGSAALKHFFKFDSAWPFAILALAIVCTVPLMFRGAYLRARHNFGIVSLISIIGSTADLILAAAFVSFGWGTIGAMFALVLGQFSAFLLAAIFARREGFTESFSNYLIKVPDIRLVLPELKYAGLVLIASLVVTGMYSIDTIVIKHYFTAHTAGLYAGISTIARIVFFLTAPVVQVLLPYVKLRHTPRQNKQMLLKSLLLVFGIGGATLAIFAVLPRLVIRILMGSTYLPYAYLLPRLSLVIFVISLINLFVMYHLALQRYWIGPMAIIGTTLTLGLIQLHHASLMAIINGLLYGSLGTILLLGGFSVLMPKLKKATA